MPLAYRCVLLLLLMLGGPARALGAQDAGRSHAGGARLHGTVFDSLLARPIPGALVQLVGNDPASGAARTVTADSLGRFTFAEVPIGTFTIGFLHPLLDSLGLEPMLHTVTVRESRDVDVPLATPSARTMRAALCGPGPSVGPRAGQPGTGASNAVITGMVRDARTQAPLANAHVTAAWLELTLSGGRLTPRTARRAITTTSTGWFALCDVPSPGAVRLQATRDADSTDAIEVEVTADGFFRRELFIGPARLVAVTNPADSADVAPRRVHIGDARVTGSVTSALSAQPLVGALATISNGVPVRTNARGDFLMVDAPLGTRMLDVRAVGYFPQKQAVDVMDGAPPLQFALATLRSVLDTVKVLADYERYSTLAEVRERQRSGLGRFITAEDVARRGVIVTTDLFRNFPGVYAERDGSLTMRGVFEDRCAPAIFLNGSVVHNLTGDDLDLFVPPERIIAVEVYAAGQAPPQFSSGLASGGSANGASLCGSLVFWTR